MAFEQRELNGSLFRNDRKQTEKHPDYTGDCLIDGKKYWISAWVKDGAKGKYFSMAFKPKDAPAGSGRTTSPSTPPPATSAPGAPPAPSAAEDDVPF